MNYTRISVSSEQLLGALPCGLTWRLPGPLTPYLPGAALYPPEVTKLGPFLLLLRLMAASGVGWGGGTIGPFHKAQVPNLDSDSAWDPAAPSFMEFYQDQKLHE